MATIRKFIPHIAALVGTLGAYVFTFHLDNIEYPFLAGLSSCILTLSCGLLAYILYKYFQKNLEIQKQQQSSYGLRVSFFKS